VINTLTIWLSVSENTALLVTYLKMNGLMKRIVEVNNSELLDELTKTQSELDDLREELAELEDQFDTLEHSNTTLKLKLSAAEQRNAELVELLDLVRDEDGYHYTDKLKARIEAALKPTESGASE
jgi:predicted  nucleic acid-binding Zn-ribbon protein